MLAVEGLTKHFGVVKALTDASLSVRAGTVHALLGENGAGKSTLTKCLGGVVTPDRGTISIDGNELALGSPGAAAAAGIHTAYQELSLIPQMTVAQNMLMGREPRNPLGHIARRRMRAEARALLEEHGAGEIANIDVDAPIEDLSLAERQVVEVTRALSNRPRVLIFDESTSAMTEAESAWVLSMARRAAEGGTVVLYISHRMQEVREVADEFTILRNGSTALTSATDAMNDEEIVTAMLGRRIERVYPERREAGSRTRLEIRDFTCGSGNSPVEFEVREGEILGLGGLEGQGQLEVMAALAGDIPWTGSVRLDGEEIVSRPPATTMRKGLALVPQDRQADGLFPDRAIRDNVALSALNRMNGLIGVDRKRETGLVEEICARIGLDVNRIGDPVRTLSGGNQQKAVLGRVLLTRPKVLLLADCTRGVDVGTRAEIHELIAELAEGGVSVIMYASDLSEMAHLCHRAVVMSEGSIVGELNQDELSERRILELAVGGQSKAAA
jgi:ABC-type sugar transport system ATPase subunit